MMRVGILTSGGDAPGMNAAIRAAVRSATDKNIDILGIRRGLDGLVYNDMSSMNTFSVANILQHGGTMLETARSDTFMTDEGFDEAINNYEKRNLDAIIIIGGNGSILACKKLETAGLNTIFIPATIDNDLGYSDYSIGFDTALNTIVSTASNIRDTALAHERSTIIEVMGRNCGDLALHSGIGCGADIILLPEIDNTKDDVLRVIKRGLDRNKRHSIIIRAEGASLSNDEIIDHIKETLGREVKTVILGYIQRGGSPSASDRLLASTMGKAAIDLASSNISNRAIGIKGLSMITLPYDEAIHIKKNPNLEMLELADILAK